MFVGYADNPLVEAFWTCRHQLIRQLAAQQWDLVLACNLSPSPRTATAPSAACR